jgi:hypothetical protein
MNRRGVFLSIVAIALCISCLSEEQKREQANKSAIKDLENLDMTAIDSYPLFDACDEMITTADCFYKNLHEIIDQKLKSGAVPIQLEKKDSIYASITVSKQGRIQYDSIFKSAAAIDKDQMDALLKSRLHSFPVIESAIKSSRPVATTYKLPIIFSPVDSLTH